MDKSEEEALRQKIRAEEEAKVQKEKDEALKKKIRAEERDRARNGSGAQRLAKTAVKKGLDFLKDSMKQA